MEHIFKSLGNEKVIDLVPYIKEKFIEKNNEVSLYIGCDSQNVGKKTFYACVIILKYGNNGGHILYTSSKVDKIKDRFTKLWKEVELSIEVARYLSENNINTTCIDVDLNPDPKHGSNNVLKSAVGFIEGYGYVARCKPFAVAATYCADKICKPKKKKNKRKFCTTK